MYFRYLVLCNGFKKVVSLHGPVTATELSEEARKAFPDLQGTFRLQVFDEDFGEYVDLEFGEEVKHKAKIQVLQVFEVQIPVSSHSELLQNGAKASEEPAREFVPVSASASRSSETAESGDASSAEDHNLERKGSQDQVAVSRSGWYTKYKLPQFPEELTNMLKSGAVKSHHESAILDIIFESIRHHTLYPTPREYAGVVEQLVSKFPKIAMLDNTNNKELWLAKLKYKFQNKRNRSDDIRKLLQVQMRKRKQPMKKPSMESAAKQPAKPKFPPMFGLQNYLPERPKSEDPLTIKAHIEWLAVESKKKRPDFKEVTQRMDLTFPDRRHEIVEGGASSTVIKEKYPWLFMPEADEFLAEFRRIHGEDLITLFHQGLQRLAEPLSGLHKERCKRAKKDVSVPGSKEEIAIQILPTFFKEDLGDIFISSDKVETKPMYVRVSGDQEESYELVLEEHRVCEVQDKVHALACYVAGFYIFHLAYEPSVMKILEFCQLGILQVKDACPVDKSVINLLNKLKKNVPSKQGK
ncbi:uncharacterized protein LOC121430903 isoform X3 [Lytechinus variegatus]|uniref:uncharacterized protein LOC121430903 isoform X3 n=1 Tax=Lytechinus variegatus TaxID=7654 RepID=UPI001BB1E49C|nr:uncharacterized protein LOC121430903 isoform X3 [Lytechinus variegatus]